MHASQVILVSILTSALTTGSAVYLRERLRLVDGSGSEAGGEQVTVPRLLGLSESDARANLSAVGLLLRTNPPRVSKEVEPDLVAEQAPQPGFDVAKGTTVSITLAAARPKVPLLVGQTKDEVQQRLEALGLEPKWDDPVSHPTVEEGAVAVQVPAAGDTVATGATVALRLSSGPELMATPKVTGLNVESAKKKLQEAGLELGDIRWVHDPDLFPNAVLVQDPKADENVVPGTSVNVTVNRE